MPSPLPVAKKVPKLKTIPQGESLPCYFILMEQVSIECLTCQKISIFVGSEFLHSALSLAMKFHASLLTNQMALLTFEALCLFLIYVSSDLLFAKVSLTLFGVISFKDIKSKSVLICVSMICFFRHQTTAKTFGLIEVNSLGTLVFDYKSSTITNTNFGIITPTVYDLRQKNCSVNT